MEPNKLDSIIKEKLEARKIQPSAQAWDRLDAMLTFTEKPKRSFTWMYIAASFLGFVIIGTVFFREKGIMVEKPGIEVVAKEIVVPRTVLKPTVIMPQLVNKHSLHNNNNNNNNNVVSKTQTIPRLIKTYNSNTLNQIPIDQVSIINQKTVSNSITSQTNVVSVDELLAAAGKLSTKEKQLNTQQLVHVNATNLLSQVDGELELSFREKVINKVSKNYQTVKVALANRNFE